MNVPVEYRNTLRELARRVAEIAAEPGQDRKRRAWIEHNGLRNSHPLVLGIPEGAWLECIPDSVIVCQEDILLYGWEKRLRMMIYMNDVIKDDSLIDPVFNVGWHGRYTGWGLAPKCDEPDVGLHRGKDAPHKVQYHIHPAWDTTLRCSRDFGAYHLEAPIKDPKDIDKIHANLFEPDVAESERRVQMAQELFGDLLDVRAGGWLWVGGGIASHAVRLRGLEQLMMDCFDRPQWVHEFLGTIARGVDAGLTRLEKLGCLSTNHQFEWIGTGGIGYTDELPAEGFDPDHVRLKDIWGIVECQDLTGFSPDMFAEFFVPHFRPMMERFGLNYFGCCEPVHDMVDSLKTLPKLRRISISPWCDIRKAAEGFGRDYVLAYKPNPTCISTDTVNEDLIRRQLTKSLRIFKEHDCIVEVMIKDLHTVCHQPERITRWVEIAREAVTETYH